MISGMYRSALARSSSSSGRARAARLLAPVVLLAVTLAGCGTPHPAPPPPVPVHRADLPTDTGLPASAARALGQRFGAMHPVGHASGHLQVDDADDLAVVLAPAGQAHDVVVAVLVTGPGGDYRVALASKAVAPGCETCTTTVDIARHVLSVHVMRPSDPDFERVTYQFGYRDAGDVLRLIGVTAAQPAGDDPIAHGYAISTDLLGGAKVDTLDPTLADPARRRELRTRVPLRPVVAFEAFAFTPQALGPELRRLPVAAFEPPETLPPATLALLRTHFPGASAQASSSGALRADGGRDVAVVLALPAVAGADADTLLALLVAQPDGSLKLGAASGSLSRACRGCEVQVQIAHRALVVQTTAVDAAGTHIVGYQFAAGPKDRPGALRLLGVRTVLAQRSGGDSHRYVNTANLATGDKVDAIEDVVRGHRNRVERAGKVAPRPPIALAGFVFDPGRLDAETRRDFTP
jgi:hypothetical protein